MTHPTPSPEPDADGAEASDTSRRGLLRAAVIGGAGAAVGAIALGGKTASADAEPGPLELGEAQTNTSTTPTTLVHTPAAPRTAGPSTLSVGGAVPAADFPFPGQVGGYGDEDVANGVHGSTDQALGFGVVAANLGGGAQVLLVPSDEPAPTGTTHVPGELFVGDDGTLWFAVPLGADDVRWIKLAGTSTSGAFHAINPARSYDSRKTSYTVNGPLGPNLSREISVADDHHRDSGAVTTANVVPVGATAVMVNVTVSSPTNKNYIAVTAGNVTTTATSLQNWDAGVTQIANSVVVPLSPTRTIRVHMGDQAGSADIIVDVFGYYM